MSRTHPRGGVLRALSGRRRAAPGPGDEGIALLTVVGTMAVVTALLLGALAYVLASSRPARADQDAKAAVAAAQAGVEEYVSRLSANDTYWTSGNTDAANAAFTSGVDVPGTGGSGGSFRYKLLNSATDIANTGTIALQVTGSSSAHDGGQVVSRTLIASLKANGFLNYIYFTDVEGTDPALYRTTAKATSASPALAPGTSARPDPRAVDDLCSEHYWQGRRTASYVTGAAPKNYTATIVDGHGAVQGTVPSGTTISGFCSSIQFTGGDTISGPFHSNDVPYVQGPVVFAGDAGVYWPDSGSGVTVPHPSGGDYFWTTNGAAPGAGTADQPGHRPALEGSLTLPQGQQLLKYVQPKTDSSSNTDRPGCLYTGATQITFLSAPGPQGEAQMQVLSPNTTTAVARCYATGASPTTPQTVDVPPVIVVQPSSGTCTGVGYPRAGEATGGPTTTDYACTNGTAFVQGVLTGQTTISASNDIVVTGDTTYADGGTGTDVLGLIAVNNVWVYHPVTTSGTNLLSDAASVHTIDAAILSLGHSFLVQNWALGGGPISHAGDPSSKLTVLGSISQGFRGPVGTGSGSTPATGYLKNYVYDQRFDNGLQPPYFVKPTGTPWAVTKITDG